MLKGRGNLYAFPRLLKTNAFIGDSLIGIVRSTAEDRDLRQLCIDIIVYFLCLVAAPPCNQDTSLPVLICNESCAIFKQALEENSCAEVDDYLIELRSTLSIFAADVLIRAYFMFDCEDPSTYFFMNFTSYDSDICTELFSPETLCK